VESFGTGTSPIRMLLATDVASEGVNLHRQCHNIIHYDLPWSIITLIQRNGRIDRFGQRHSPVVRYLMVSTDEGFLDGDQSVFERLVDQVEEINRSTRTGESVLKQFILNPPPDLRRRLGAPGAAGDVVFGATSIPEESWPDDGHLYLTEDSDRVDRAIRAALAQKGQWSGELLLTE